MELSGTVHLNEASNNRYQFIYGSLKDATFFGVYAKFTVEKKTIKKVEVRSVNYNVNSRLGIKNMSVNPITTRTGKDHGARNSPTISFDCIGITLDLQTLDIGESPFREQDNLNIPLAEDLFLEVVRNPDPKDADNSSKEDKIEECKDSFLPTGEKMVEIIAPGGICPRGYSKIILS